VWLIALLALAGCDRFREQASDGAADLRPDLPADLAAPDGGCSDDPGTDPHNCGACGRDCQGGACVAGECQPLVLAASRAAPQDLAVAHGFVYWVEQGTAANLALDGKVMQVPVAGCPSQGADCPKTLAQDQVSPGGVAVDQNALYWLEHSDGQTTVGTGRVWQLPLPETTPVVFASGQDRPRKVAIEAQRLFWVTSSEMRGKYLVGGTGDGLTLADNQPSPVEITVHGTRVYWTNYGTSDYSGSVMKSELTGAHLETLADKQQQPRGIAAGPTFVYWANAGNGTIMRVDPQSPSPEAVASSVATPNAVELDQEWLYYLEGGTQPYYADGRVVALRLDGSEKRTLATGQIYPRSLALDATCVYWVNRGTPGQDKLDGAVMKSARPR